MLSKNDVVGVWKLLTCKQINLDTGKEQDVYGQDPNGYLCYTPEGRMFAILTRGGEGAPAPSPESWARSDGGLNAYGGTFSITPDGLIHHVGIAMDAKRVGSDQVRYARLEDGILKIESAVMAFADAPRTKRILTWQKIESFA